MVSEGNTARFKIRYTIGLACIALIAIWLSACSPTRKHAQALKLEEPPVANLNIETERFTSFDGAKLGLTVWNAQGTDEPEYVVVGVHGMNDYAAAFE